MVKKRPTSETWPIVSGDYIIGDSESPVAVTTLASHNEEIPSQAGAAIAGPCKTENLGIEKMMANIISNPNIRFLILCGAEVQGHVTGQSIMALHKNGVDEDKGNIIGAVGAIPYIENIPKEGIERFQQQLEIINMIDNENEDEITIKVKECIEKDPGAFESEIIFIELIDDVKDISESIKKPISPNPISIEYE